MLVKTKKNIQFIKLFLFCSFIVCWVSISSSYEDLLIFKSDIELNILNVLNFLRHISIYLCLFFLLLIIFFYKNEIFFKKYIIFYFFIAYFISQIIGLFLTDNLLGNISFTISALTTILTVILIDSFFLPKEKKFILFISFMVLNLVFFLTFTPLFIEFINGGNIFYGVHAHSSIFLDKIIPRSSGLARTALIILILIEFFEIDFLKKNYNIINFIKILFLVFILLFQSRTILFLTSIVYFFIFINKNEIKIANLIKFLFVYFILPLVIFLLLTSYNSHKKFQLDNVDQKKISFKKHLTTKKITIIRTFSKNDISSGRFQDWKQILKNINDTNIIYGFGPQGDRYLINQSASNGLIHAYACSGLIGLVFFSIFSILVCLRFIKLILYNLKDNLKDVLYCLILILLTLRSVLETSYAVYSIDLIVFVTVLIFILDKKINIEDIKIKYFR